MKQLFILLLTSAFFNALSQSSSCATLSPGGIYSLPCQGQNSVILASVLMPQQAPASWNFVWTTPVNASYSGGSSGTITTNGVGAYTLTASQNGGACTATSFFTVVACANALNENTALRLQAQISPNPGTGLFWLSVEEPVKAILYDQLGAEILIQYYDAGKHLIDLKGKDAGLYILKLETKAAAKTFKILKTE